MNILIPHHWLLEHLETKVEPAEIARCLSLCGPSVERIHELEGEPVYDIEVTTNRVDMMSVRGIAREAAAILPEFGHKASLIDHTPQKTLHAIAAAKVPDLDITISDPKHLSRRIVAIKLSHVAIKPSPPLIQKRLLQVGQRPINNIIDMTNYVMWEFGHPIHAFDYDQISTKQIHIREAKPEETLTTLDGKTHKLHGGEVVFDDGNGTIIDLPGIMGTENTVIGDNTTNVLLWIESIDARKIRSTSMNLQIRTQAAILNEKHVDPELAIPTLTQAVKSLSQTGTATVASNLKDQYHNPMKSTQTTLTGSHLESYLGTALPEKRIVRILTNLGCIVSVSDDSYTISPPSWRSHDLQLPVDYIEEIARIYGYHNLESKLMATAIPDHPTDNDFFLENQVKQWLAGWGATEVYTYSMVSKAAATQSGYTLNDHLQLKNPYTADWQYLRRSLIPSLLEVVLANPTGTLTCFELQNTYHPSKLPYDVPQETITLAIVSNRSALHLKGLIDALAIKLHLPQYHVEPLTDERKPFLTGKAGVLMNDKLMFGYWGEVAPGSLWAAEISFANLASVSSRHPRYLPHYTTSPIIEDLTFTIPVGTHVGPVMAFIQKQDSRINSIKLKSTYQQNYTFTITYQDQTQQLTDQEIKPIRKNIVTEMKKRFNSLLVGQLT
jgi:phenylalanyl-tRNA synthetase beta chain